MYLRCFIAVELNNQIRKDLGDFINILKKQTGDVKWVSQQNLHITLKFLGNTQDVLLPEIKESLLHIVSSYNPFYIKIYGTGIFPSRKNPKILWTGITNAEPLVELKGEIENAMELLGFEREDKQFRPHLTIGRVKSTRGINNIINELDRAKDRNFGVMQVDRVNIIKSTLKPGGSEYTSLDEIFFGQNNPDPIYG